MTLFLFTIPFLCFSFLCYVVVVDAAAVSLQCATGEEILVCDKHLEGGCGFLTKMSKTKRLIVMLFLLLLLLLCPYSVPPEKKY
jgi:hypothetical protein